MPEGIFIAQAIARMAELRQVNQPVVILYPVKGNIMARDVIRMPELHEASLQLIREVHDLHQSGGGGLSLLRLLEMFSADLPADVRDQIVGRGDIILDPINDSQGTFINESEPVEFELDVAGINAEITIPRIIQGGYVTFATDFVFSFQDENTLSGCVRLIIFRTCVDLENFSVNENRIDIDFSGESVDQCIIHRP